MKYTRFLAPLLALCLLTACGSQPPETPTPPPEPQPEQFVFTRENFPRLNGSTSTVPLGQAIASVLLGESREEVSDLIQFSKTTQSYRELMWGGAELLIAAEPAEVIWQEKEESGFEWEMEPFAVDGLVFIVNAPDVEVLLLYWLSQRPTWVLPILPILKWIRLEPSRLALWLNPIINTLIARLEMFVFPTCPLIVICLVSPTSQ